MIIDATKCKTQSDLLEQQNYKKPGITKDILAYFRQRDYERPAANGRAFSGAQAVGAGGDYLLSAECDRVTSGATEM